MRRPALLALAALVALPPRLGLAEESLAHAMDFDFGKWQTHSSRLLHPLSGSTDWKDMDGYTDVKPIWDGKGNIAEFKGDGPAGHVELIAIRTFDPGTNQWYLNFSHPNTGTIDVPAIGAMEDGKLVFYDQETLNGKRIWVRFSIWGISPDTAQSEQAFSADAGRSWETNWINRYTRVKG